MTWNYRVIRCDTPEGYLYTVCSAYYNDMGEINGHSVRGAEMGGESMKELQDCFEKFKRALAEPVVHFDPNAGYEEVANDHTT